MNSMTMMTINDNDCTNQSHVDLEIPITAHDYQLEKSICNHGFFMTPPNQWIPSSKSFSRSLRLVDGHHNSHPLTVNVTISVIPSALHQNILVRVHGVASLTASHKHLILQQISRMLRISKKDDKDIMEFHKVHVGAKRTGFGRLFRSPDLFEDIIKSIILCNANWKRTLQMSETLCEVQGQGNFPSFKELTCRDKIALLKDSNLGYRTQIVIDLAQLVEDRKLDLKELELLADEIDQVEGDSDVSSSTKIYNKLKEVKGIGPFVAANILMCMGFYHKIPIDSETIALMDKVYGKKLKNNTIAERERVVSQIYKKYAPYQCLAYWYDLTRFYEKKIGQRLSELTPARYGIVSTQS